MRCYGIVLRMMLDRVLGLGVCAMFYDEGTWCGLRDWGFLWRVREWIGVNLLERVAGTSGEVDQGEK